MSDWLKDLLREFIDRFNAIKEALAVADSAVGFNGQKLSDVANPTSAQDAATKAYADNVATTAATYADTKNLSLTAFKTADYPAAINDLVFIDGSTTHAITLPTAVGNKNKRVGVLNGVASAAGTWTVGTTAAQTINGAATDAVNGAYVYRVYISDGANWFKAS